jgi:LmbE family N-acetylglucosaminyl deacetylase
MNRKKVLITVFSLLIVVSSAYIFLTYNDSKYPQGININSSDRVLIIAPHPDDESIACAGVIRYCIENKIPVYVVVVTNGGNGDLGVTRYHESLNATKILGLQSDNITFFEYTQGVDSLFNENWDKPIGINGNHTPNFAYQKNTTFKGVSLEKNFESVITNFNPTVIIYPNPDDSNPDHWGTSSFVEYTTNKLNYEGKKYTYLVHVSSAWPFPRGYFPQTFLLPPYFLANQNKWHIFPISNSDEKLKYDAINSYKSQLNGDPTYLLSFIRKNELFIPYEQINVSKDNSSEDFINNSKFPKTLFHDPQGDALVKSPLEVYYSIFSNLNLFDLTDIGFEVDNNTTWMSMKTAGGISKTGIYDFRIRSFVNGSVNRIDVRVQNGKAKYLKMANNSETAYPLEVKVKGKGIILGMPSDLFNATKYMISVDAMRNNRYIDRAGWYTFNIL